MRESGPAQRQLSVKGRQLARDRPRPWTWTPPPQTPTAAQVQGNRSQTPARPSRKARSQGGDRPRKSGESGQSHEQIWKNPGILVQISAGLENPEKFITVGYRSGKIRILWSNKVQVWKIRKIVLQSATGLENPANLVNDRCRSRESGKSDGQSRVQATNIQRARLQSGAVLKNLQSLMVKVEYTSGESRKFNYSQAGVGLEKSGESSLSQIHVWKIRKVRFKSGAHAKNPRSLMKIEYSYYISGG